jgi:hypothetical protein
LSRGCPEVAGVEERISCSLAASVPGWLPSRLSDSSTRSLLSSPIHDIVRHDVLDRLRRLTNLCDLTRSSSNAAQSASPSGVGFRRTCATTTLNPSVVLIDPRLTKGGRGLDAAGGFMRAVPYAASLLPEILPGPPRTACPMSRSTIFTSRFYRWFCNEP